MHVQAEEERRYAKMQALQAAFPALAIGAGAVGALVGGKPTFPILKGSLLLWLELQLDFIHEEWIWLSTFDAGQ